MTMMKAAIAALFVLSLGLAGVSTVEGRLRKHDGDADAVTSEQKGNERGLWMRKLDFSWSSINKDFWAYDRDGHSDEAGTYHCGCGCAGSGKECHLTRKISNFLVPSYPPFDLFF